MRYYRRHKRDLPWRRTNDPYHILVSEVMLQQTQVERVIPKYKSFLLRFPTLRLLARARFADVLREWLGLGYNGRALRLWQCARSVVRDHDGQLPHDAAQLQLLPGIGSYTAAAVAAIAFGERLAVVDVNVRRVLARALDGKNDVAAARVSLLAQNALPQSSAAEWAQALMDVGATYCKVIPRCQACPLRASCAHSRQDSSRLRRANSGMPTRTKGSPHPFLGSTRYYRGRVMQALSAGTSARVAALGRQVKDGFGISDEPWLRDILQGLARDGLIRIDRARDRVRVR